MLVEQVRHVQAMQKSDGWLERMTTPELYCLRDMNSDCLKEEIELVDEKTKTLVKKMVFPKGLGSRYALYEALRKHGRCKRDKQAEQTIKEEASK